MEEDCEVEHPVTRELFRQSSFEVQLSPALPSSSSSSEDEEEVENVAPRIVDAVLKNPVIMITDVKAVHEGDKYQKAGSSKTGQMSESGTEMYVDDAETDSEVTAIMSAGDTDGSVGTMKGTLGPGRISKLVASLN